jgi:hypothetical protein
VPGYSSIAKSYSLYGARPKDFLGRATSAYSRYSGHISDLGSLEVSTSWSKLIEQTYTSESELIIVSKNSFTSSNATLAYYVPF